MLFLINKKLISVTKLIVSSPSFYLYNTVRNAHEMRRKSAQSNITNFSDKVHNYVGGRVFPKRFITYKSMGGARIRRKRVSFLKKKDSILVTERSTDTKIKDNNPLFKLKEKKDIQFKSISKEVKQSSSSRFSKFKEGTLAKHAYPISSKDVTEKYSVIKCEPEATSDLDGKINSLKTVDIEYEVVLKYVAEYLIATSSKFDLNFKLNYIIYTQCRSLNDFHLDKLQRILVTTTSLDIAGKKNLELSNAILAILEPFLHSKKDYFPEISDTFREYLIALKNNPPNPGTWHYTAAEFLQALEFSRIVEKTKEMFPEKKITFMPLSALGLNADSISKVKALNNFTKQKSPDHILVVCDPVTSKKIYFLLDSKVFLKVKMPNPLLYDKSEEKAISGYLMNTIDKNKDDLDNVAYLDTVRQDVLTKIEKLNNSLKDHEVEKHLRFLLKKLENISSSEIESTEKRTFRSTILAYVLECDIRIITIDKAKAITLSNYELPPMNEHQVAEAFVKNFEETQAEKINYVKQLVIKLLILIKEGRAPDVETFFSENSTKFIENNTISKSYAADFQKAIAKIDAFYDSPF